MNHDPLFDRIQTTSIFGRYLYHFPRSNPNIVMCYGDGFGFDKLRELKDQRQLLLTNYEILEAQEYSANIFCFDKTYYGLYFHAWDPLDHSVIDRDFNLLCNRFDIFRQSWLYQIIRNGWLDRGYVSFNCRMHSLPDDSYHGLTAQQCFEKAFLEHNSIFSVEHQRIKDQIPYQNFQDVGDPAEIVLKSKFSMVLETWFHDNRFIGFTEKTMRVLQLPRPWLLFASSGAVAKLRSWGFDVMDDIIDHSYDDCHGEIDRQRKILATAQDLMHMDISLVYQRCLQASVHNQWILRQWYEQWIPCMQEQLRDINQRSQLLLTEFKER